MTRPTTTMWNPKGNPQRVIINLGDAKMEREWRESGYELESVIRKDLPDELKDLPMEEVIEALEGKPPKPKEDPPPDMSPKDKAAQDQAADTTQAVETREPKEKKGKK